MFEQLIQDREPRTWKAPLAATGTAPAPAGLNGLLMRMLDEIDYGLVLVGTEGQLRYANQLGLKEVLDQGALQLLNGRIQARAAADQAALLAALADARRGLRRLFNAVHEGAPVSVAVVPLGQGADDGGEPMALLVFGKRQTSETLSLDFFARTHGLTAAEAAVLKGMCGGLKPKEVARQQGVAISTVRSHICSIRIKTHTGSIRELLSRVAVLPPITSAVKSFNLPIGSWGLPTFTH